MQEANDALSKLQTVTLYEKLLLSKAFFFGKTAEKYTAMGQKFSNKL